jgi:hypothetical protein
MPVVSLYMREEVTRLPCGWTQTQALLEQLWIATGADCDGEQGSLKCPCGCGQTHRLELIDAERRAAVP